MPGSKSEKIGSDYTRGPRSTKLRAGHLEAVL